VIINADDFGRSERINEAIVRAFDDGLVSSTTLMANMPGFDDACRLVRERELLAHVGTHLVLSDGEPLTSDIRSCARFCDERGRFVYWRSASRAAWLRPAERRAVLAELRSQVERCRDAGIRVTHLDSHHHVHNQPAIAPLVLQVARELGVPAVRVLENRAIGASIPHRVSVALANARLRHAGLARTRYFGTVDDHCHFAGRGASARQLDDFEIMTHPVLDARGVLVDGLHPGRRLREHVGRVPGYRAAVSYAGARYR
jgi:chitin disaccharide deacetylase